MASINCCLFFFLLLLILTTAHCCQQMCVCDAQELQATCAGASFNVFPIMLNPDLRQLKARHTQLQNLTELWDLYPKLELLELDHNQIEKVYSKQVAGLNHLRVLSLTNNRISHIQPDAFVGLRSLQQLLLNGNLLTSVSSSWFNGLRSLRRLDLTNNALTALPALMFYGLNQLQVLGLGQNQLTFANASLAVALSPAHLPALRILDLSGNPLQLLHGSFSPFSTQRPEAVSPAPVASPLKRLYHHRQLAYDLQPQAQPLSSERPWTQLRELRMNYCGLQHVDVESLNTLGQLEVLQMNFNEIPELHPNVFSKLASLKNLNLAGNQFTRFGPNSFASLSALETLDLSNSSLLTEIADHTFSGLLQLKQLSLNHCGRLRSLPGSLTTSLPSLAQLLLRHSRLNHLPTELAPLFSRLTHLDLTGSKFNCSCSLLWLSQLLRTAYNHSSTASSETLAAVCAFDQNVIYLTELSNSHLQCDALQPTMYAFCVLLFLLVLFICLGGICFVMVNFLRNRAARDTFINKNQLMQSENTLRSSLSEFFRRQPGLYASSLTSANAFGTVKNKNTDFTRGWLNSNTANLFPHQLPKTYPNHLQIGSLLSASAESTIISGLSNAYEVVSVSGSTTGNGVYSPASLDSGCLGHNYASLYETCGPATISNLHQQQLQQQHRTMLTGSAANNQFNGAYLHTWNPSFEEKVSPMIATTSTLVNMRDQLH